MNYDVQEQIDDLQARNIETNIIVDRSHDFLMRRVRTFTELLASGETGAVLWDVFDDITKHGNTMRIACITRSGQDILMKLLREINVT